MPRLRKGSCVTKVRSSGRATGTILKCTRYGREGTSCEVRWGRGKEFKYTSYDVPLRELRACTKRRKRSR